MSDLDSLRTERDALQEAHDRLCAELAEAKAQITKLHHQHTKALALLTEHHADRIRDLGLADAVTRKEFDELERERDRAEHEREQASFRITELEHETEHLTTQLDGCDAEVKRQMEARRIAEAHKALAIRERDAQHALVLKLTAERDELSGKIGELESTRDLLLTENARLQQLLARPDPVVHETPVDGVVPCCGRKLADLKDGSYVNEGPLVNCDRMRLLTRVGELTSANLLLTKERDDARAQAAGK